MKLTYNSIFSIFIKQYPRIVKYKINSALISIIYPDYERINDSDFAHELFKGKRNPSKRIREKAKYISFSDALANANKSCLLFNDENANRRIKYMIMKLCEFDTDYDNTNNPMYRENYYNNITKPWDLSFTEFMANFVIYACSVSHCPLGYKISDENLQTLETCGKNDAPYIFLENDKAYLKKYNKYYNKAVENFKTIKTILYNKEAINFYDIYVTPDISTINESNNPHYKELKGADLSTKNYIVNFGKHTSIIAPGGFGKSMFLKHLFLCNKILPNDMRAKVIPILLHVRSFGTTINNIEDMLFHEISKYFSIKKEQFLSDLKSGNFLLLFDGLDEIKANNLECFFDDLNDLIKKYPHNYFITSSRPSEQAVCLNKFKLLYLNGLSIDKAVEMITKFPNEDKRVKEDFCNKLKQGTFRKHSEIVSNPLLLTLMYISFKNECQLPTKRSHFYRNAFSVLYESHDDLKGYKNRKYKTDLNKLIFLKYLAEFCFTAITNQYFSFSEDEFLSIFDSTSFSNVVNAGDFLYDLTNNLSLVYYASFKYHFIHRSFQEYFAAFHCNLLTEEKYADLVTWFNTIKPKEQRNMTMALYPISYGVFEFLYDLNHEKLMNVIIKPYLSNFFISTGNQTDDFLYYLNKVYKEIEYGYTGILVPTDELFKIIQEKFAPSYLSEFEYNDINNYSEYISNILFRIETANSIDFWSKENIEEYISFNTEKTRDKILQEFNIDFTKPTITRYKIPIKDIIADKKKFKDIIDILQDRDGDLWKIYFYIKKLLMNNSFKRLLF